MKDGMEAGVEAGVDLQMMNISIQPNAEPDEIAAVVLALCGPQLSGRPDAASPLQAWREGRLAALGRAKPRVVRPL
jgi:hypothetical protein